ncbi:hypothetical protein [Rhizohabitans arisaemae]|uniref:hypothetical protein n=1 Tax=Rhizohabitans arisaemae TaxID=2720610 RepID=UPI0024B1D06B|nr:hypothetical protein [Rhizohabitans arisaemae]
MGEFEERRTAVRRAVDVAARAKEEAALAAERVARVTAVRDRYMRFAEGDGARDFEGDLDVELRRAQDDARATAERSARLTAEESDALTAFTALADPRQEAEQMSDAFPVLLGPVRVETRFTATELLIRIFPDDWAVDAHEPRPSESELGAVNRYRRVCHRADPITRLAAWRDLTDRIGPGRAAWLLAEQGTRDLADPETTPPGEVEPAPASWTRAARAKLLPDRFVVVGFAGGAQVVSQVGAAVPDNLVVSPDPSAADQLRPVDGGLHIPQDLRWLTDFTRAVEVGMGFRVPLTEQIRGGLDRLLVLGLRLKSDPQEAKAELETHLSHLLRSPAGLSLIPQGTPTNNTEQASAGTDPGQESEALFLRRLAPADSAGAVGDWTATTDGQRFAELLGIDPAVLDDVPGADGTDQREARAAAVALWPATWGNHLKTPAHPALSPETVEKTREFFTGQVSGRGPVPAVRIGRQPYGILPTTAFSRLVYPETATHRRGLQTLLAAAAADWAELAEDVPHLGAEGDGHRLLLGILGLHPTSAEFHHRYAQSVEDLFNRYNLNGSGGRVLTALTRLEMPAKIRSVLTRLGYPAAGPDPALSRRLFTGVQYPLHGPLVDDLPLSESTPIRAYTADGKNYLAWLAEYGRTALDTVRNETGFADDRPPAALLYLLLRHAVLLGWADTARLLAAAAGGLTPAELALSYADPLFIHVSERTEISESGYRRLYSPDPAVTGAPDRIVADFIPGVLGTHPATRGLADQLTAIELLRDVPTARLERVLVEHLDCCAYRLDAWRLGLANERLAELRYTGQAAPVRGLYLGMYGWLEDVRPRTVQPTPVTLTGELAQIFTPPGAGPLVHDPAGGGHIHALSLNHAATAAILRAGYLADASSANPGTLSVNLSSERVRIALSFLEGIRGGQPLGALLGYQFERGLHDRHDLAEVDVFISALRREFPLVSGKLGTQPPPPGTPIESIEARNVVDGLALVQEVTRSGETEYPFGRSGLPPADGTQKLAINAEVARLLDIEDALADLALAESVHQAALGNSERAAATLDAYAKAGFPPDPAVVETPRSGVSLTHRLSLHLRHDADPGHGFRSPRGKGEPAVDDWLDDLLPSDHDVAVRVTWTDPVSGAPRSETVTQDDLDLGSVDLLALVRPTDETAMTDLDDRIVGEVVTRRNPRPDAVLAIEHTRRVDGRITFFELSPLIAAARTLLSTSRALRPSDLSRPASGELVQPGLDDAVSLDRDRPVEVRRELRDLRDELADYIADLAPLVADPAGRRAQLLAGVDVFLTRLAKLLTTCGNFGLVRSGWGELTAWRRTGYLDVLAAVDEAADRMAASLAAAEAILEVYDDLPSATPAAERFRLLQQAERLLTTTPTSPRPNSPSQLRTIVRNRRNAFDNRLDRLRDIASSSRTTISGLLADVRELLPIGAFDAVGLDLAPHEDRVIAFCADLLGRARAVHAEILTRLAAADAAITAYDAAGTGPERVAAATEALKAMLGADALVFPSCSPPGPVITEWRKALQETESGRPTRHLSRDFPVDDWLHGVARVRDKARLWERITLLAAAFGRDEPELTPVQFPFTRDYPWLGLELPEGHTVDDDRLLYTAHYTEQISSGHPVCGVLLDEWTEVIPAAEETTGIAFHYDRPGSEPPQAFLLVVPPRRTGKWAWEDLVAALGETLDLAKARAVEPTQLDDSAYGQLLPATVLTATRQPITISTDLVRNNLAEDDDG